VAVNNITNFVSIPTHLSEDVFHLVTLHYHI